MRSCFIPSLQPLSPPNFIRQSVVRSLQSAVCSLQSAVRSPQSAVRSPQSAVRSPQSAVRSPQSAVRSPQSAVRSPRSAVRGPRSAVRGPRSAVRGPRSAVRGPRSAVRGPQSAFHRPQSAVRSPWTTVCSPSPQSLFYKNRKPTILDRVNRSKRCLFRRYARRRAFITKTKTNILFTNTTWIAFRETATGHFHFRNNEMEDMLVYQRNPGEVELFPMLRLSLRLCYIFCAQKSRPTKWKVHILKARLVLVEERSVHNMLPSCRFLFARD